MRPLHSLLVLSVAVGFGAVVAAACGSSDGPDSSFPPPDAPTGDETPVNTLPESGPTTHDDFKDPVFMDGAMPTALTTFANPDGTMAGEAGASATGPCLYEPEMGSLFPANWLRPRFRFNTSANENLFQITMTVPNETSPLVLYTTKSGSILDKGLWQKVLTYGAGTVHVVVRSAQVDTSGTLLAGPFKGTEGDIEIAPPDVVASGSVLYWTTSGGTVLKGFQIGDESVQPIITPAAAQTQCVACHTSTPDGLYAGLTGSTSPSDGTTGAYVTIRSVDGMATEPPFLSAAVKPLLARQQWAPSFSKAHWQNGDHTMLSMMNVGAHMEILWTDLEATTADQGTAWNTIARTNENTAAASVIWSHDGTKLAYTETTAAGAGVIASDGQIHIVPYNNRAGGTPTALSGASDPTYNNYYPNFSADDQLLAFNRVPTGQSSYNNPAAEVYVVDAAGGKETRLAANDPPACLTAKKSPGLTNSWAKFSPEVRQSGGKSYYFLVFSSTRNPSSNGPQLYVSPIVVEGGAIKTYAALMLWNQPEAENNHTPAWDVFQLPGPK